MPVPKNKVSSVDAFSRHLINTFQGGFPLTEQPYAVVAKQLYVKESFVIQRLALLLETRVLTRFGPLFDASQLGGGFTLAALQVPEAEFESVAHYVNSLPEVAHNYKRDHALNMWFVVACDQAEAVIQTLTLIEKNTGFKVYNFPKEYEFYIGLWLEVMANGKASTKPVPESIKKAAYLRKTQGNIIDDLDREIIKATQAGLPLDSKPYTVIAKQLGSTTEEIIQRLKNMLATGVVRRIGVVPNHYKLGLLGNGMSVWDVPDTKVLELGEMIGQLDFVSHAYQRPRHLPLWSYNLFAMVHGHNRDEVAEKVAHIAELLGDDCRQHEVLFSTAVLKKTGLRLVV